MGRIKSKKKIYGKDYLIESREVDVVLEVKNLIPEMNVLLFAVGTQLHVSRCIYERDLHVHPTSVSLVTLYLYDGNFLNLPSCVGACFQHYFKIHELCNAEKFINNIK